MNNKQLPRHYYPGYTFIPKEGYFQVRKIGLTAGRVRTDPRFHKTRVLAGKLTATTNYAKLIRAAVCAHANIKGDAPRLLRLLHQVWEDQHIKNVENLDWFMVNLDALEGFNLNRNARLEEICKIEPGILVNEETGQTAVTFPSFVPAYYIHAPQNDTHCRIYMITACIDMVSAAYTCTIDQTTLLPLKKVHIPARTFISTQAEKHTVTLVALGINWYTQQAASRRVLPSQTPGVVKIIRAGRYGS